MTEIKAATPRIRDDVGQISEAAARGGDLVQRLLAMVRDDAATDTPDMWSLTRAVWTANFVRGTVMDDVAALRAALVDLGMAIPGRIWDRMADPDDHLAEALADRQRALDVNLDGVPRFYVDGHIIQAWHPIEDVETGLREALIGD